MGQWAENRGNRGCGRLISPTRCACRESPAARTVRKVTYSLFDGLVQSLGRVRGKAGREEGIGDAILVGIGADA